MGGGGKYFFLSSLAKPWENRTNLLLDPAQGKHLKCLMQIYLTLFLYLFMVNFFFHASDTYLFIIILVCGVKILLFTW